MSETLAQRHCARCGAPPPLHVYPVGDEQTNVCTRCWETITSRRYHDVPRFPSLSPKAKEYQTRLPQ